ncbi:uncharacterized protein LOC108808085 [Raphanus sativus]|uniref:Uncharacterized protein LOC108808085 n=1 Tax=Raphanus sativus TaxID=3726 RepID=A0A6J0JLB3_RAPSA|nr:uncharacterized protein LOC108808085 [Raphanus sativus]
MTLPRNAGGLGFREIEQFNDALLAKLAWRILKTPDSLLAQTLLGKYCHSTPFLASHAPSNSSHGWRGILAGREVLLKGLGWVVGSVRRLNVEAIRQHLPQYEDLIRAIPLSQYSMQDELVWLPDKTGTYTTKTGYALCKINVEDTDINFNWKKLIWGVKTTPKLKHFLWKVKNKAIPVGENLLRRGIEVEGRCKRCGILETDRHLFSQCPFAIRVWNLILAVLKPNPNSISTPASLLTACHRMINLPPSGLSSTDLFPWVLWYLWIARNKLVFENLILSEQEVATLAIKEARTWQAAQAVVTKPTLVPASTRIPRACGSLQTVECFVDAAWNTTTRGGGFGCIFKDPVNKRTYHQKSANRCFVGSAFIAEAIAIKTAFSEAVTLGLRTLIIRSDSLSLISTITSKKKSIEAQGVLFDIEHLCSFFHSVSFYFVPRLNNTEADALAKISLLNLVNSV